MPNNLTIQKIIGILLHRIKFIIIVTLAMGVLFFCVSKFFIPPTYETSAMIYVQNYKNDSTGSNADAQKIYQSDISGSSNLASVCVTLFKNSDEITALYNGCNVNISVADDSFFITIYVSGNDAQDCANVANQITEKCADVFNNRFVYGQIGTIRTAKTPERPSAPNNPKNALLGLGVGLVASCLIVILLEIIDTTIKSDDNLSEIYNIPVFAEIPDFESSGR